MKKTVHVKKRMYEKGRYYHSDLINFDLCFRISRLAVALVATLNAKGVRISYSLLQQEPERVCLQCVLLWR